METKTRTPKVQKVARPNGHAPAKVKTVRKSRPAKGETPYDRTKHLLGSLHDLPADLSQQMLAKPQGTLYDRIKHLSGILDGPGDLNTNMETKTRAPKVQRVSRPNGHANAKVKTVRKSPPPKPETPYDRIKHLLNILTELPSDLRTNPKYFEGFGS